MNLNIGAIKAHPAAQESLRTWDYFQAVLDVGYAHWNTLEGKGWSYAAMAENAERLYGNMAKLVIFQGKYNQQVGNGGHTQYFDNGYADGEGDCFSQHDAECPLHQEMIHLFRQSKLALLLHGKEVLRIMEDFHVEIDEARITTETCDCCGGSGEEDEGICSNCDGSGQVVVDNPNRGGTANHDLFDQLDDRYYAITDDWVKEVNQYLSQWFASDQEPLADQPVSLPTKEPGLVQPKVRLVGHDANAFAILGTVTSALQKARYPAEKIAAFKKEATAGDYNHLLATVDNWVDVR